MRPPRLVRLPGRLWHRSLLARVLTTTLLLSTLVTGLLAVVLFGQVGRGLVDAQRRQAVAEVDVGLAYAQKTLSQQPSGGDPDAALEQVFAALAGSSASASGGSSVLLLPSGPGGTRYLNGVADASAVPATLRAQVVRQQEAYAYVRIGERSARQWALVIGAPLRPGSGPAYELYYVFPLTSERATLDLVRDRLLAGSVALVLLLAGIAGLVARQVVTPVRLAARSAGRLASGLLNERMRVRGDDDLARLASSFNGMADALAKQIGQLEHLSSAQRRFTADVSHELRTPLTTVRMAADVLHRERAGYPPDVARSAELLQDELDRFEALLADLLEISRYDAQAAVLEADPVDLAGLVRDVALAVGPLAEQRGVPLDLSAVPAAAVLVEADARRVSRIVRNLLANAVEHAAGQPVEVLIGADDDVAAVVVRDHGPGLRAGDEEHVFERFWRADPSRARRTGGTGLGLSIAREDALLHGGRLEAAGSPGEGASFRLLLPRRHGEPVSSEPLALRQNHAQVRAVDPTVTAVPERPAARSAAP